MQRTIHTGLLYGSYHSKPDDNIPRLLLNYKHLEMNTILIVLAHIKQTNIKTEYIVTRINKALLTNRSGGLLYTAGKFIKYFRALKYILSPCIYKTLLISNVLNDHADNGNISGCKKRRRLMT